MKFIHLADLHIGKIVNGFSMLEDQEYILNEIIKIIEKEQPDGVLIAGDVYDKTTPSSAAVALFDDFLFRLSQMKLNIFIISGNHDSAQRLSFGFRIMEKSNIYIAPVYNGNAPCITLYDEYGPLNVYMLPFVRPRDVKAVFPDGQIESYTDALRLAVENMKVDTSLRNILVAHQFVTGARTYQSEEINIGGLDNVDADVFDPFDYVALGHIHGPQNIANSNIRYCGTPLKYSFSECSHQKSVTVVNMAQKGKTEVYTQKLIPLRDMAEIRGSYADLTAQKYYKGTSLKEEYLHITLTDEEDVPEALGRLRSIYHNLMKLDYDNKRTRTSADEILPLEKEPDSPADVFRKLYVLQNNCALSDSQEKFLNNMIDKIWEDGQ